MITESREPTIDEVYPGTDQPPYINYEEYLHALRKWDCEEILRQIPKPESSGSSASWTGIGIGSGMAMILSFELNHSIWYMILHGICSWVYVIYRAYEGNY